MAAKRKGQNPEVELAEFISNFYADPLGYVMAAFPWGEGALAGQSGPDVWQREFLLHLGSEVTKRGFDGVHAVEPIREAVSSGHGIGKSTMSAWVASWIMDTRPYSIGTVTANTGIQLKTKTFAAIKTWKARAITSHWWDIGAEQIRHKENLTSWFCQAQTSNEDKSEAFAGQHAANSSSWYLFDEASAIPDKIWEVARGGITDGEPFWFAFGNPTKNSGNFYEACFGRDQHRWNSRSIDSRSSSLTNKSTIEELIADKGEDSDEVRVRVRGLPPRADTTQFIPLETVRLAMKRPVPHILDDEPLLIGVDISRGGSDPTVVRFRRGADAVSIKPIRISAEDTRDSMRLVALLADIYSREHNGMMAAAMFLDETGVGGPVGDRLREMRYPNIIGVGFGHRAPVSHCANMRSYIWYQMRDWLKTGCIGQDEMLEEDLSCPGFSYQSKTSAIVLETKEAVRSRLGRSPDDGDALAVTFAVTIGKRSRSTNSDPKTQMLRRLRKNSSSAWMA